MLLNNFICLILLCVIYLNCASSDLAQTVWRWECQDGNCVKLAQNESNRDFAISLQVCKLYCNDYGGIWPSPTGEFSIGSELSHVNLNSIDVELLTYGASFELLNAAGRRFNGQLSLNIPESFQNSEGGRSVLIYVSYTNVDQSSLTLDTDESYNIIISSSSDGRVNVTITAGNFFGARHGLETLRQLFVYDDIRTQMQLPINVKISDQPVYPYRGLLLDTVRNYHSVESIKRTIDAMGVVKLNTFHWHITDTQSFPLVSKLRPNISMLGAYSSKQVYTPDDINEIVKYGLECGVRVLPEFDAPAHVGEGYQGTNLVVCFMQEPWATYCAEPPCGQFNPIVDELYDVLEDFYKEMFDAFKPDIFHMGGDEVNIPCWEIQPDIVEFVKQKGWPSNNTGYHNLWDYFQQNAAERVYKVNGGKKLPLILWTSGLTNPETVEKYLNKDDYIIQVWTTGKDPQVAGLLEKGYRLIMSNYDANYLDCGFSSWVAAGNNWCSPYIPWQTVYDNSPCAIAGNYSSLILGGEVALWSETSDSSALDTRLWPRAAASAERLWAEPSSDHSEAYNRLSKITLHLKRMGLSPEPIFPQWCYQNEGVCKSS